MQWNKKGLIYAPPADGSWRDNSALTPTPFLFDDNTIRVYCGFRDKLGVSRIGSVDLDANNPSKIKQVSKTPVLDVGEDGLFDDNGVILGDVIRVNDQVWMYYVGFQLVNKVKFLAYSGLAVSNDGGDTFTKLKKTPILDRADEGLYIRAIHSVIYEDGLFKVWYATGNGWENINETLYPQYDINYIESNDGIHFKEKGIKNIINNKQNLEYRIGRPRVYKDENGDYIMNYTYGTLDGRYHAGQAITKKSKEWTREDRMIGIGLSDNGWDSIHLCYPAILAHNNRTFMFYNGNNMGVDGFGYAELIKP